MKRHALSALAFWLAAGALTGAPALAQGLRLAPTPGLGAPPSGPAAASAVRQADYIVVVVNSEPITNNELRVRVRRYEQQLARQGVSAPPRAELTRELLERLIVEKAQLQLARENGMKMDDGMVDIAEQNLARQNQIDVAELRRRLTAEGLTVAQFREDLRNQLLLTRIREREIEAKVRVSDLEVDQFLRERQQATADAGAVELNLAHVLVPVPENATPGQVAQLQSRAQQALARARAGEDFAQIAREMSSAAGTGAPLGLRPADRYPPLFVEATRNLPVGGVSEVVRSGAGFHVVKVIEKRQGEATPTVVQTHARHILLRPDARLSEAAARQRLADYKRRVEAGSADFAQLAREHSQDGSARDGGDLGWVNPGVFVPEFEEVLNALAPGKLSEPVVSRFGVHLIQLLERREAPLSLREQRELARNLLREKKMDEAYANWVQEVRSRAWVEYREAPQL